MTLPRFKSLPLLPVGLAVFLVTLIALGAVLSWITLSLREDLRAEITERDTLAISALAQMEAAQARETYADFPSDVRVLLEVGEVLLNVSNYENLLAAAVVDESGYVLEAIPFDLNLAGALPSEWALDQGLIQADSLFIEDTSLDGILPDATSNLSIPLLYMRFPLQDPVRSGEILGFAYFIMDGHSVQRAYTDLDIRLTNQVLMAVGSAGLLILVVLGFAYKNLDQAQRRIRIRTAELSEANRSLNLALKNSAIGNVTAHLLHDLKNPLWGLFLWVEDAYNKGTTGADKQSWNEARLYIERIQSLIQEVTSMLGEQAGEAAYEIEFELWFNAFVEKARERATKKDVRIHAWPAPDALLDNLQSGLCSSILMNLVQNAIDVSPEGGCIQISPTINDDHLSIAVTDAGPGLPDSIKSRLFQPVKSTKLKGSGIGLALSHQLATAMGAELKLVSSSPEGTSFALDLPVKTLATL